MRRLPFVVLASIFSWNWALRSNMKLFCVLILLFGQVWCAPLAMARSVNSAELSDPEIELLYGLFKEVRSFGLISVSLVGDAEKIGLDEFQLTHFLDDRFRRYFCNTEYEDLTQDPARLAAAIAKRDNSIGIITFRIWVIGEDYPLAYHIRCDAGTFENPSIWTEEVLGHGSKRTAPNAIKTILNELMKELAENFLKARGEKCVRQF